MKKYYAVKYFYKFLNLTFNELNLTSLIVNSMLLNVLLMKFKLVYLWRIIFDNKIKIFLAIKFNLTLLMRIFVCCTT